jgi:ABC-type antimicrobial peptide transport system ATPase subunit
LGSIDEEKQKIVRERESLEKDLTLAEEATAARFRNLSGKDISSGVDPEQPGPPLIVERPTPESIKVWCPTCRKEWADDFGARKKELLRILHGVEIHDYPDTRDIFNALQFDNTERHGCEHGHFVAYARCSEDVEDGLKRDVWRLIRYRKKIRGAIKALEPARAPKDDTIWGHI